MIQDNIKTLTILENELRKHPVCFEYEFDEYKRLTIIFPCGYFYKNAQGIRLNESSKSKNIRKGLEIIEEVWKDSMFWEK